MRVGLDRSRPHDKRGLLGQLDARAAQAIDLGKSEAVDRAARRTVDASALEDAAAAVVDEMVDRGIMQPALEAASV